MTADAGFSAGPQSPPTTTARPSHSPAERLAALQERKRRVHQEYLRLDGALAARTITLDEYRFYIGKTFGGRMEHEELRLLEEEERAIRETIAASRDAPNTFRPMTALIVLFTVLVLSFGFLTLFLMPSHAPATGLATFQPSQQVPIAVNTTYLTDAAVELNVTNITGLSVSGTLENGTGEISLLVGGTSYLVWSGSAVLPSYSVSTDKESYALDEAATVTVVPADAPYTLWLTDETGTKTVVDDGFAVGVPGAYTLDALINASGNITKETTEFIVRNDTDTANDILRTENVPTLAFTDACDETCEMNTTGDANLTLSVTLSEGATLAINTVTKAVLRANAPPELVGTMPNITVHVGETAEVDLAALFADADNDTLMYDYLAVPDVDMALDGSVLSVTGVSPGSAQSIVYASDLYVITQSNLFTITITPATNTTANVTNTTENTTITTSANATGNETANVTDNGTTTTNETNTTTPTTTDTAPNTTVDCTATDPNDLPIECLYANATDYFPNQEILLTDLDRKPVARFTPIGNLLLTGRVIQQSGGSPGSRDFRIGYVDPDGNSVATIWIDSSTGDLHLRGTLHEENANLQPTPGSYSLVNKRSVFLAYADQYTGELYVRGNAIPYRTSIMG